MIEKLRAGGVIPENETSIYAAEGTVAHEIRELCLDLDLDPGMFVGKTWNADGYSFTIDDPMADHLQRGIDWVREHTDAPDVEILVDLSPWLPGQFGTCDTGWIEREIVLLDNDYDYRPVLSISDLKYGQGENVDVLNNKQLRLYALGYWHFKGQPKVDRVVMNIDQPRSGGMKFWEISLEDLLAFGEEAKAAYRDIVSGNVKFAPSKKACRWCPVKDAPGGCPARNKWMLDMVVGSVEDLAHEEFQRMDGVTITPERRWQIVHHADDIRAWLAQLHSDSLRAALDGSPDPGSKAIEGDLGDRCFPDKAAAEKELVAVLGDDAFKPRELIGIGAIEKLVKPGRKKKGHPEAWEALMKLVHRPPGRPKLVSETHPSPALRSFDDAFDDLD